jgi:peptidoglycan/LPS O-acetylase OafA/YrhL
MVVVGHCSGTIPGLGRRALTFVQLFGNGGLGVSIFFVISGFLITTLLTREHLATEHINFKNFYIRRAFRIFPAFYAYWFVVLTLKLLGDIHLSGSELFSSAAYVWNYMPRSVDSWFLGHTWSLSVEEQFYLLWPLILGFATPKRAKWFALAVLFSEPFIRVLSYLLMPSSRPLIGMMVHTRADSLMIGALLALVSTNDEQCNLAKRIARSPLLPVGGLCFIAADAFLGRYLGGKYLLPIGYSMQNIAIVILIAYVVYIDNTTLRRLLNQPWVVHLGVISYSLYIWQQLFLTTKNTTITGHFPLNIVCAFFAAECSYLFLERPFLRWRRRFSEVARLQDIRLATKNGVARPEAAHVTASAPA